MPNYTLNYFNGRGRAELTRLVFAAADAKYVDKRVEMGADWPGTLKAEAPLGQLPFLDVDGVKIPQSLSIARMVARENNLAGKTSLEQAQADAIVDTVSDLINNYYSNVFHKLLDEKIDAAEKKKILGEFLADKGTKGVKNVETLIEMYGKNGYSVGDSLTWADLIIFDVCSALFSKVPDFSATCPKLTAVHDLVKNNANIAAYIKSRPVTPF